MKRTSTEKAYLEDKTLVIDADGIPVDLTLLNGEKAEAAAERAAKIADSTSWNGDRLTVNGKTSPPLTGPRGPEGIGNTTTVKTEAEAKALTGLPKGHKVYVVDTGTWYEEAQSGGLKLIKPGVIVARCDKTTGSGNETFSVAGAPIPGAVYSWYVSLRQEGTLRYTVTAPPDVSGTLYLSQPDGSTAEYRFTGTVTVVTQQTTSNSARVQASTAGVPVTLTIEKLA